MSLVMLAILSRELAMRRLLDRSITTIGVTETTEAASAMILMTLILRLRCEYWILHGELHRSR